MKSYKLLAGPLGASVLLSANAQAGVQSQVQFEFIETGFATAYSALFTPGNTSSLPESFGGYTLTVGQDSSNVYGGAGADPYISMAIQINNVGATPPSNPLTIGMTITGLTASPGTDITFNSSFTSIFHSSATANFSTVFDLNDALFGQTRPLSSATGLSSVSTSFDQSLTDIVAKTYSMTVFVTFNPVASAHPTLDGTLEVSTVPEPRSLAILSAGLVALGLLHRPSCGGCRKE